MWREVNYIIVMNGFTATGKSTIAEKLLQYLENVDVYHSAIVREELGLTPTKLAYEFDLRNPIFVKKVSPLVYEEMSRRAKQSLGRGRNVILDASHSFFWQRNQIYNMALFLGVYIYILRCVCEDEEEIRRRLGIRKEKKRPLNEAPAWKTYISTVQYSEPVEEDRLPDGSKPKIIEYDTCEETIKTFNIDKNDEMANKIIDCLKKQHRYLHLALRN
jgi:predicted kinase